MSEIILGKPDCTCFTYPNHLFLVLPNGTVLPSEGLEDDWVDPPGTIYVTVPASIVDYLQSGGLTF